MNPTHHPIAAFLASAYAVSGVMYAIISLAYRQFSQSFPPAPGSLASLLSSYFAHLQLPGNIAIVAGLTIGTTVGWLVGLRAERRLKSARWWICALVGAILLSPFALLILLATQGNIGLLDGAFILFWPLIGAGLGITAWFRRDWAQTYSRPGGRGGNT